jgi:hypothetical protein
MTLGTDGERSRRSHGSESEPSETILDSETVRPALVSLTRETQQLEAELLDGFSTRRELLEWSQAVSVRTLGVIEDRVWRELGSQFAGDGGREGTLLRALLDPSAVRRRGSDIPDATRQEERERFIAAFIAPAFREAFRHLRKDAGEYVSPGEELDPHDPRNQNHIAMRPSLSEIDRYQSSTLAELLDGFSAPRELLEWSDRLTLATHGETGEGFLERCYLERSAREVLLGESETSRRAREHFAAYHVIPRYNAGIRDLAGRSAEIPDAERKETGVPMA